MKAIEYRDRLFKELSTENDTSLLKDVLDFFLKKKASKGNFEELPKELQDLLVQSNKDIDEGNVFSHDDVMNNI